MIKVGLVSLAHMHGLSYARALENIPAARFVGIYDRDEARGKKYAGEFAVKYFPDLNGLLAQVDAVMICSENALHAEYTLAAAKEGKDVLCEKPLATTVKDGEEMVRACQEAGVILQTAFPMRFSTPLVRTKQIIESGALGKIVAINGTNHGRMPPGWFLDPQLSGGGAVFDHTVHVVDLMRWYLGAEVQEVYAEVDTALHKNIAVDDVGTLTMQFTDGTIATLDPSWSRPRTFPIWGDVTLKIIGTSGSLAVDAFGQVGEVFSDEVGHSEYYYWGDNADFGLVQAFIESIKKGRPPQVSGLDGLRATEVALAAYESAWKYRPVKLR